VSLVHDAVQALGGRAAAAALIACLALLGGCGGSSRSKPHVDYSAVGGVGASIRSDNCSDWQRATVDQRRTTVVQLRNFAGGPVGSSAGIQNGPVLSDQTAYKLLGRYCSKPFARGFKLYKLYTHAAAFIGH